MVAPRKTPCVQLNDCKTSGTVVLRRPPKMIAEIGTPSGSLTCFARAGLLVIGEVNLEFAWAAFSGEEGVHFCPFQSIASWGGSPSFPSHQTSPSGVIATLVKMVSWLIIFIALGFD